MSKLSKLKCTECRDNGDECCKPRETTCKSVKCDGNNDPRADDMSKLQCEKCVDNYNECCKPRDPTGADVRCDGNKVTVFQEMSKLSKLKCTECRDNSDECCKPRETTCKSVKCDGNNDPRVDDMSKLQCKNCLNNGDECCKPRDATCASADVRCDGNKVPIFQDMSKLKCTECRNNGDECCKPRETTCESERVLCTGDNVPKVDDMSKLKRTDCRHNGNECCKLWEPELSCDEDCNMVCVGNLCHCDCPIQTCAAVRCSNGFVPMVEDMSSLQCKVCSPNGAECCKEKPTTYLCPGGRPCEMKNCVRNGEQKTCECHCQVSSCADVDCYGGFLPKVGDDLTLLCDHCEDNGGECCKEPAVTYTCPAGAPCGLSCKTQGYAKICECRCPAKTCSAVRCSGGMVPKVLPLDSVLCEYCQDNGPECCKPKPVVETCPVARTYKTCGHVNCTGALMPKVGRMDMLTCNDCADNGRDCCVEKSPTFTCPGGTLFDMRCDVYGYEYLCECHCSSSCRDQTKTCGSQSTSCNGYLIPKGDDTPCTTCDNDGPECCMEKTCGNQFVTCEATAPWQRLLTPPVLTATTAGGSAATGTTLDSGAEWHRLSASLLSGAVALRLSKRKNMSWLCRPY